MAARYPAANCARSSSAAASARLFRPILACAARRASSRARPPSSSPLSRCHASVARIARSAPRAAAAGLGGGSGSSRRSRPASTTASRSDSTSRPVAAVRLSLAADASPGSSTVASQRASKNLATIPASLSRTGRGTLAESTSPGTASARSRHRSSAVGAGAARDPARASELRDALERLGSVLEEDISNLEVE